MPDTWQVAQDWPQVFVQIPGKVVAGKSAEGQLVQLVAKLTHVLQLLLQSTQSPALVA